MTKVTKIAFNVDDLYIIRSICTWKDGAKKISYYESPSVWNNSPTKATIFTSYEAAESHFNMYHTRDKAPLGWSDNRKEVIDVVPLHGEIVNSPNVFKMKMDRG